MGPTLEEWTVTQGGHSLQITERKREAQRTRHVHSKDDTENSPLCPGGTGKPREDREQKEGEGPPVLLREGLRGETGS